MGILIPVGLATLLCASLSACVALLPAVFLPPRGMDGVRIPLAGVLNVELQRDPSTGAPRQMTVESCFGRLDRFTFGQTRQRDRLDSEATASAAAALLEVVVSTLSGIGHRD